MMYDIDLLLIYLVCKFNYLKITKGTIASRKDINQINCNEVFQTSWNAIKA